MPPERFESWKEIAAYLNRSERTVRRWETTEGLPVHRLQHSKRGSVYAYVRELDEWRQSRADTSGSPGSLPAISRLGHRRSWYWSAGGIGLIVVAAAGIWTTARPTSAVATHNPEAVRLVERASVFSANAGRVQIETAIRTYQEAIRLDPGYARAWTGLATAHLALVWFGEYSVAETVEPARREAQTAITLDPSLATPWRVLAFVSHYVDFDHVTAEARFRKGIELNPSDAVSLSWYGDFLTNLKRFDEARRAYERAQHSRPTWLEPITFAANLHYFAGHPGLAIAEYERVLAMEPNFGLANHYLGKAHLAAGRADIALSRLERADELLGGVPLSRADLGYALAVTGRHRDAEAMLADMLRKRSAAHYPAFAIAIVALGLGRTDEALDWMEKAVEERLVGFYFPSIDPMYAPVRTHPRFRQVLERIRLLP